MRAILILAILGWAATANAARENWKYCGGVDGEAIAFFIDAAAGVSASGEYRTSVLLTLLDVGALREPFATSCRTFYSWIGRGTPFRPAVGSPHWRATQVICGTDVPSEGGK